MDNYFKNAFTSELLCQSVNHPNITVGSFTYYSGYYHKHSFIDCVHYLLDKKGTDRLFIGNYCSIGSGAVFMMGGNQGHNIEWTSTFPFYYQANIFKDSMDAYITAGDTIIENDVWIGSESMILSGIHIGSGAVIAARAVVTKDVPPYAIVAGNPASIIKYRFNKKIIKQLLHVSWWNWSEDNVKAAMPLLCSNNIEGLLMLNRD